MVCPLEVHVLVSMLVSCAIVVSCRLALLVVIANVVLG
jgi:hypothetical protein